MVFNLDAQEDDEDEEMLEEQTPEEQRNLAELEGEKEKVRGPGRPRRARNAAMLSPCSAHRAVNGHGIVNLEHRAATAGARRIRRPPRPAVPRPSCAGPRCPAGDAMPLASTKGGMAPASGSQPPKTGSDPASTPPLPPSPHTYARFPPSPNI